MLETAMREPVAQGTMTYLPEQIECKYLRPTERINKGRVASLARQIEHIGVWTKPILVEASSLAIMDGHHRFHAARILGIVRLPCLLLSYDDPNLQVVFWAGGAPFEPTKILDAAKSGALLNFKTTKHSFAGRVDFSHLPLEALR